MLTIKDGGPAFPMEFTITNCVANPGDIGELVESKCVHAGMTLRDYFAAKALQGDWAAQDDDVRGSYADMLDADFFRCAIRFYRMADAMIAAREVQP